MLKIYGIYGRTQAVVKFPINHGRGWLECEFKHGRVGAGLANRPATFPTNDPVKQAIIESSPYYGQSVVLFRAVGDDTKNKPADTISSAAEPEYVTGVTSREEAVAYLKAKGAKATNLKDDAAIKKYMDKIGIIFPNYEF